MLLQMDSLLKHNTVKRLIIVSNEPPIFIGTILSASVVRILFFVKFYGYALLILRGGPLLILNGYYNLLFKLFVYLVHCKICTE